MDEETLAGEFTGTDFDMDEHEDVDSMTDSDSDVGAQSVLASAVWRMDDMLPYQPESHRNKFAPIDEYCFMEYWDKNSRRTIFRL